MAHPLLLALFQDSQAASAAAQRLRALGVAREDLSIVAVDHQTEGKIADRIGGSPGSEIEDSTAASRFGELSGYILAAIAIGMPGTGALVGAGPLAAELGEAAGHVAGDLKAALLKAGLSEAETQQWRSQIDAGAVLLGVHARAVKPEAVDMALARYSSGRVAHTTWPDD
jgi:hypothetical protein